MRAIVHRLPRALQNYELVQGNATVVTKPSIGFASPVDSLVVDKRESSATAATTESNNAWVHFSGEFQTSFLHTIAAPSNYVFSFFPSGGMTSIAYLPIAVPSAVVAGLLGLLVTVPLGIGRGLYNGLNACI